jgi:YHS domain-containing protein
MPTKVVNDQEKELYLQPGGKYSLEDIQANGSQTATQKFANFMSAHDMNPKPGARICPVTRTLANAECSWVIGGQEYQFCCPPCIDEFVKLAKEKPEEILNPAEYVK